jgi:hypothetical protein
MWCAIQANSDALTTILKVKSLAAEVGGMSKLKALLEKVSKANW